MRGKKGNTPPLRHALDVTTGEIVHISDIQTKHTKLICPSENCQWPLTPVKNTTIIIPHFRHKPDPLESERECRDAVGAQESVVHRLAKEVIIKRKNIYLFSYVQPFKQYKNKYVSSLEVGPFKKNGSQVKLTHIESEIRRTAKDYQPDITAKYNDEDFIIEIHYKHLVDDKKLEKIKRDDIPAIEISLGHLKENITPYEIDKAIINPSHFKWLHFPKRWLSKTDLSKIEKHELNQKNAIDAEIEFQKKKAKDREQREAQRQEEHEKARVLSEATRHEHVLVKYIQNYIQYVLKENKVTAFSNAERKQLSKHLAQIENGYSQVKDMLSKHRAFNISHYISKSPVDIYKKDIKSIGEKYRDDLASDIYHLIPSKEDWIVNHLLALHACGWRRGEQLANILNFKKINEDNFIEEGAIFIREYLRDTLLPECNKISIDYIKSFK